MEDEYLIKPVVASLRSNVLLEDCLREVTGLALGEALTVIRGFLRAPGGEWLLQLEERLLRLMNHLAAAFSGLAVGLAHRSDSFVKDAFVQLRGMSSQGVEWSREGPRSVTVRFLGGLSVPIKSPYVTQSRPQGSRKGPAGRRPGAGCYPALVGLGIRDGASPGLQSAAARQVVRLASFEEARAAFAETGNRMNVKTVRRIALAVGEKALVQRRARIDAAQSGAVYSGELAGQRVVIGVDGGRVRLREGGDRGRRRPNGHRGFHANWREPKLFSAYVIDEEGRPVRTLSPVYEATMDGPKKIFELLVAELRLRGIADAKEVIVTGDGASWIWNWSADLPVRLGIAEGKVTRVADFFHTVEHLQMIADSRKDWPAQDVQRWVNIHKRFLRQGRVNKVIADIRSLRKSRNRALIKREIAYFTRLSPFMRYDFYRDHAIPLGSGAIESAIRRVVNLRLKAPGTFWKRANAEIMLHLRCYLKAARWNELMTRVIHATPNGLPQSLSTHTLHLDAAA
ncbi:MAG TPA: hypothetical protein VKA63_05015 [Candidatus Krumholzibacteria bacterium]|nr:hypothetical protein [Candidatus Krumholzibacteria bacterium]